MGRGSIIKGNLPAFSTGNLYAPGMQVKLVGNWDQAIREVHQLGPKIKAASIKAQIRLGSDFLKVVKNHILNQDLPWKPLSPEYERLKQEAGLDTGIYYAYGNYFRSLEVWKPTNSGVVLVGIRRHRYTRRLNGKKSRVELAVIAAILEFGTSRIPKRPIWNPSIKEFGLTAGIRATYIKHLLNIARRSGVKINLLKSQLGIR